MKSYLLKLNNFILRLDSLTPSFCPIFFEKVKKKLKDDDLLSRSFAQYKCQFYKNRKIFFINLLLLLFVPFLILIPLVLFFFSRGENLENESDIVSVLPDKSIIPESFDNNVICSYNKFDFFSFTYKDLSFCYGVIFRYFFKPFFWLKCLYVICAYCGVTKIGYKEILVSNEYSFTSSILTKYFRNYEMICSNCMHGEKVLCLRDCYSTYDNFYVWDNYYSKLLESMSVKANFKVAACDALGLDLIPDGCHGDIIFYLQGFETIDDLVLIREKLEKLSQMFELSFFVKPHPRYFNKDLNIVFDEKDVLNLEFKEAVLRSKIIVSNYSTVLFQAFYNRSNKKIPFLIVNDLVSIPEKYIMSEKADMFFSDF